MSHAAPEGVTGQQGPDQQTPDRRGSGRHAAAPPLLRARGLTRRFGSGRREVLAVDGIDLDVPAGRLLVVRGRSGSGKTTLLNLLAGLDRPTSGTVRLADARAGHDQEISAMSQPELVELRRRRIGVVFQTFALLGELTAAENVGLPLRLVGTDPAEREQRVAELLDAVGLPTQAAQRPDELSGGQQQRVAVARALATAPDLLIADEPTAQLDSASGALIMALLSAVVHERGGTAVVATHDPVMADLADLVVTLRDGRLA